MTMDLFHQFLSPKTLGVPLMLIALIMPSLLLVPQARLIPSRPTMMQTKLILLMTKHLMFPLNKPGHSWATTLSTILWLLLITNLLGLLPYTFTPTTQLSMNMSIALPLWLTTVLIGMRTQTSTAVAHMLPIGTPVPLIPALVLIETISTLIRPIALGVRLTANLTAGHLLIALISTTTFYAITLMPTTASIIWTLLLLLTVLEVAVAMIQAYVLVLLLSLYLQENT